MTQPLAPTDATWQRNAAGWRLMRGQRELARIHRLSPDCAADFPLGIACEVFISNDDGEPQFFAYGGTAGKAKALAHREALARLQH